MNLDSVVKVGKIDTDLISSLNNEEDIREFYEEFSKPFKNDDEPSRELTKYFDRTDFKRIQLWNAALPGLFRYFFTPLLSKREHLNLNEEKFMKRRILFQRLFPIEIPAWFANDRIFLRGFQEKSFRALKENGFDIEPINYVFSGDCTEFVRKHFGISSRKEKEDFEIYIQHAPPISSPVDDGLVVYFETADFTFFRDAKHFGISQCGKVISKWGYIGPLVKHNVEDNPFDYARSVLFFPSYVK